MMRHGIHLVLFHSAVYCSVINGVTVFANSVSQVMFMDSTQTFFDCLSTVDFHPRLTICFSVTTSTVASSL